MEKDNVLNQEQTAEKTSGEVKTPMAEGKTNGGGQPVEAPDANDLTDVINLLNEVDQMKGGKGGIKEIPSQLGIPLKYVIGQLFFLRTLFEDPLWQKIMDDLADQREDGQTPSILVAIARNVPMETLQNLQDQENYADIQKGIDDQLSSEKQATADEEALLANFEASQQAGREAAKEYGLDEADTQKMFETAFNWLTVIADGMITKEEWTKVIKQTFYDQDTEALKAQIPEEPVKKVVLPDKASVEAKTMPAAQKPTGPQNMLEAYGGGMPGATNFLETGKRKVYGR